MACNANTVSFELMLRSARRHHPDKNLSTLTLVAVFGTDDPLYINNLPRETFDAQVDAMKRELGLPVKPSEAELAERRAALDAARAKRPAEVERIRALERPRKPEERHLMALAGQQERRDASKAANDGETPKLRLHAKCSTTFPETNFNRNFSMHVSGYRLGSVGQQPTPVKKSGPYCHPKTGCEDCQRWVQKLAEGTASLETPGAGWVRSERVITVDVILGIAARVRAALPEITFGGVELPEATSKRGPKSKKVAAERAPAERSSKRARNAPKKLGD